MARYANVYPNVIQALPSCVAAMDVERLCPSVITVAVLEVVASTLHAWIQPDAVPPTTILTFGSGTASTISFARFPGGDAPRWIRWTIARARRDRVRRIKG